MAESTKLSAIIFRYIKRQNPKVSPTMVSFGFLPFGGDGGNRSVRFYTHRHAAPKNSPQDCFLNGCFNYYYITKKVS